MAVKPARQVSPILGASIREYLERIIDERDRLYDVRFKASETAVNAALAAQEKAISAALAAQEKQTASAFLASEKAIVKAEDAQREYNIRSNEFRGQLDDQAKTLMPRPETLSMFRSIEDKITTARGDFERRLDLQLKDLASLRESRSESGGRSTGQQSMWGYVVGAVGFLVALMALLRLLSR